MVRGQQSGQSSSWDRSRQSVRHWDAPAVAHLSSRAAHETAACRALGDVQALGPIVSSKDFSQILLTLRRISREHGPAQTLVVSA